MKSPRLILAKVLLLVLSFPALLLADGTAILNADGVMTITDTGVNPDSFIRVTFDLEGQMIVRFQLDDGAFRDETFAASDVTSINIDMGEGDNFMAFGIFSADISDVGFENVPINVIGGRGPDRFDFYGVIVGDVTIDTGGGSDSAFFLNFEIMGDLEVQNGAGADGCLLNGCDVSGEIEIDAGIGRDLVRLWNGEFGGEVNVDLGTGNDQFEMGLISSDFAVPNTFNDQLTVLAGSGDDVFLVAGERSVYSSVLIDGQGGNDTMYSYMNANSEYIEWSLFDLNVRVELDPDTFRGRTDTLGEIQINDGGILRFRDVGVVADQKITLRQLDAPNMIQVELDNGTYSELQDIDVSSVNEIRFFMIDGDDQVVLEGVRIRDIALLVQTSSGDDVVILDDSETGPTRIVTSTDDDQVDIRNNSFINGDLEVVTQSGRDFVSLYDAMCGGTCDLDTGSDNDSVEVDHSNFMERLVLRLGQGDDRARFLERGGSALPPNTLLGRLFVLAGEGDDAMLFAGPGSYPDVRLFGQAGSDSLITGASVNIGSLLTSQIEVQN